jgi:hypothetical protein
MSELQFIENIARITLLLPIILFFFTKKRSSELWVINFYTIFSILRQIAIQILSNSHPNIVNVLSALNPLTNFIFIAYYFYIANEQKLDKKFIFLISLLYIPTQFFQFFLSLNNSSQSIISTINTLIILGFCMAYYYNQLKNPNITFIYLHPNFWITSGLFLFSSGTFFVFWFNQIYKNDTDFTFQYVYIHAIIYIIRNFCFSIALLIKPYKEKVPDFA